MRDKGDLLTTRDKDEHEGEILLGAVCAEIVPVKSLAHT